MKQELDYILSYWHYIVIAVVVVFVLIYIANNWEYFFALNNCLTLKRLINGEAGDCFKGPTGATCQDMAVGHTFGWCNDPDNFGPFPGTEEGPYGITCNNWSWTKSDCPPVQCRGDSPYGIGNQTPYQKWGWCADAGVNRAMRGGVCGPSDGSSCKNWIWNPTECPTTCPNKNASRPTPSGVSVCNNICGNVNGKWVKCPPPACTNPDQCICTK